MPAAQMRARPKPDLETNCWPYAGSPDAGATVVNFGGAAFTHAASLIHDRAGHGVGVHDEGVAGRGVEVIVKGAVRVRDFLFSLARKDFTRELVTGSFDGSSECLLTLCRDCEPEPHAQARAFPKRGFRSAGPLGRPLFRPPFSKLDAYSRGQTRRRPSPAKKKAVRVVRQGRPIKIDGLICVSTRARARPRQCTRRCRQVARRLRPSQGCRWRRSRRRRR